MTEITYNVRAGLAAYDTDEAGAWEAMAHAAECPGCADGFHHTALYEGASLVPPEVFAVRLATGAMLYPTTEPRASLADRVERSLSYTRTVRAGQVTPTMAAALDARIGRLEAWRP